ncbi:SDR family NAD(P)-dependent oxidoreductase [Candidatus Fokinia crypta]|uniref:Short-chain reductase n=1 Tax=Candidatus Fokinia crypta TaxID=1920990 RepID=A0ABZ0UQA4_9RICK|nr:SDR family NAD(P)-dependent oxidoreductase [Candidatus Fokinia cryptica]WPX98067.1 Short-chain reductase [Candidatus Fokinia cryptica]
MPSKEKNDMKHVCITGSSSKLGTSIVDFFIKNMWSVTMHYHSSPKNLDIYLSNSNTRLICGDLRKHKDINILSELLYKSDINLLINNVSILYSAKGATENFEKKFTDVLNVNYISACAFTKAMYDRSISSGSIRELHVINILDSELHSTSDMLTEYYITKHALHHYTTEVALCFAPYVRVNGIAVGPTIRDERQSEEHFKEISIASPMECGSELKEVLEALNFLIGSKSITGEIIHLGGGRHISRYGK